MATAPVFAPDGSLCSEPGYHRKIGIYYHTAKPLDLPDTTPTLANLATAKGLLDELLCDFPFAQDGPETKAVSASRAHAIALIILPFVRHLIGANPTPMHLIDAPVPGAGKGKLAQACCKIYDPALALMAPPTDEQEFSKTLFSALMGGRTHIFIDNAERLDSEILAEILTAPVHSCRLFGVQSMRDVPVRAVWLCTSNNPTASRDMVRRSAWIRLEPKQARPEDRTGFRHPLLQDWADRNRGPLVGAVITLVRKWVLDGMPDWDGIPMGSYERWSQVIGGILRSCEIPGFLENREKLREKSDTAGDAMGGFVDAWRKAHDATAMSAKELLTLASEHLGITFAEDSASATAAATKLGHALRKAQGRVYESGEKDDEGQPILLQLVAGPKRHSAKTYRIIKSGEVSGEVVLPLEHNGEVEGG